MKSQYQTVDGDMQVCVLCGHNGFDKCGSMVQPSNQCSWKKGIKCYVIVCRELLHNIQRFHFFNR